MLRYKLFRVKDGMLPLLQEWAQELRSRETEVLNTLVHENVGEEALHLFQVDGAWFVMAMQSLTGPHIKADMTVELNRRHMAVMDDCLAPCVGETLYRFTT